MNSGVREVSGLGVSAGPPASLHRQVCFWAAGTGAGCWEGRRAWPAAVGPRPRSTHAGPRVTRPRLVLGISNAEARQPGKAPNFSVNWTVGDSAIEVINATTGKDELGRASRLCKHALYCRWMRVHGKVLRRPSPPACPGGRPTPGLFWVLLADSLALASQIQSRLSPAPPRLPPQPAGTWDSALPRSPPRGPQLWGTLGSSLCV